MSHTPQQQRVAVCWRGQVPVRQSASFHRNLDGPVESLYNSGNVKAIDHGTRTFTRLAVDSGRRALCQVEAKGAGAGLGGARPVDCVGRRARTRFVFTLVMRITANRETAEEVTLDVWRRASGYHAANGTVLGWIMNQARSRAIDRLRFESRKKRSNRGDE
jgi:hypothetical protein